MTRQQLPTTRFCRRVAAALGIPEEQVLTRAGLLTPGKVPDSDPTIREIIDYLKRLSPEERQRVREYAEFRYQAQTRGST